MWLGSLAESADRLVQPDTIDEMSIAGASPEAIKELLQTAIDQRDEARGDAKALRGRLAGQATPEDIAVIDRAIACRLLDLKREVTLNGGAMSEEDWREMDSLTRAWDRVRSLLGCR